MSLDTNSRRIQCDCRECGESLPVPIPLADSGDSAQASGVRSPAAGWVFVSSAYEDRHYCPTCAGKVLQPRAA